MLLASKMHPQLRQVERRRRTGPAAVWHRPRSGAPTSWRVPVHEDAAYTIETVEPLCAAEDPRLLHSGDGATHRVIVWDTGIPADWQAAFLDYFAAHGVTVSFLPVRGGEPGKSLDATLGLVRQLDRHESMRRGEPLTVVGGGAVLDMAGLAASIYRGGLPVVRIPTTLLAYVDASVGIKTAVNFRASKNLLGTFTPPGRVLLDCAFFGSLPPLEWTSGVGEILKLGLGCDKTIFEMLEQGADSFRPERVREPGNRAILYRSVDVMLAELSGNLYENDLARTVDLGHTFSQAFEMGPSAMRHGHAVVVDLLMSAFIGVRRGMMPEGDLNRLTNVVRAHRLPSAPGAPDVRATWESLQERTRHRGAKQRTPIPTEIGRCEFVDDIGADEVAEALRWVVMVESR